MVQYSISRYEVSRSVVAEWEGSAPGSRCFVDDGVGELDCDVSDGHVRCQELHQSVDTVTR